MTTPLNVAEQIIEGRLLDRNSDLSWFFNCALEELGQAADMIRKRYVGDNVNLCTIINARSGRCGEDCRYCAQSARYDTNCDVYGFAPPERIMRHAEANQKAGVDRFAIVTSGRQLTGQDFEDALATFELLHAELDIDLCASMGLLSRDQLIRLKQAGVTRYHHNIETSRHFFPSICTTHTFEDRIKTIKDAQSIDMEVCSGGIIGMGESWEDRIDMAFTLAELGIMSIPVNVLIAIPGTPLENQPSLSQEDILCTVAIFRFVNPTAHIRMAAGRKLLPDNGRKLFEFGASAAISGDMLTTASTTILNDREILLGMGRSLCH